MLLKVVMLGDPILRKKAEPIGVFDELLAKLASDMIETMDLSSGIGLAAPQVGHSIRMFVLRNSIENEDGKFELTDPEVYINPRILARSSEVELDEEGCLSLPGIRVEVYRPTWIDIEAQNLKGEVFKTRVEGYNARVRLHEYDHLDGVMILDFLSKKERKRLKDKIELIEKKAKRT